MRALGQSIGLRKTRAKRPSPTSTDSVNEKVETLSPLPAMSSLAKQAAELQGAIAVQIEMHAEDVPVHAEDVPAFVQAIDAWRPSVVRSPCALTKCRDFPGY